MIFLKIEKLSYSYLNGERTTRVFSNLSYDFGNNGLVMILGKSGCGKSTLLSLIAGFIKPTEGKIINDLGKPSIVFQEANLLDELNVVDNATLSSIMDGIDLKNREEEIIPILKELNILNLKDKPCKDLSGGEKSRVSLARALIDSDKLILCDEPTGALDNINSKIVMNKLKEASKEKLVVCVTHNKELAFEYGDVVLLFKKGNLNEIKKNKIDIGKITDNNLKNGKIKIKDSLNISNCFLKKKLGRLISSSLALGFAFSCLACALSINQNKEFISQGYARDFYGYNLVHASEITTISQSNGMTLTKNLPLSNSLEFEINSLIGIHSYPSLSFFIPQASYLHRNEDKINYQIEPCFFEDEVDYEYIRAVANTAFIKSTGRNIGDIVTVKGEGRSQVVDELGNNAVFEKNWNLKIVSVHKEIEGFSTPTLLYDYKQVYDYIDSKTDSSTGLFYFDLMSKDEYKEDIINSYETLLYVDDTLKLDELSKSVFKNRLRVNSRALSANDSISVILGSITQLASIFLILAIIISFFIEIFSLSTILSENKKKYAITLAFTKNKKSFVKLYEGIPLIFSFASLMSYCLFSLILKIALPKALVYYGYPNLFIGGFTIQSLFLMGFSIVFLTIVASIYCYLRLIKKDLLLSLRTDR